MHNVTPTQPLCDVGNVGKKKADLRRCRSGMNNLVPTTTGSAKAVVEVFPELKGKIDGIAVRVPLMNGSLTDIVINFEDDVTPEEINEVLHEASTKDRYSGILSYTNDPVVSSDITNNSSSCVIDGLSTNVVNGKCAKIFAWYDNEYGYAVRMREVAERIAKRI